MLPCSANVGMPGSYADLDAEEALLERLMILQNLGPARTAAAHGQHSDDADDLLDRLQLLQGRGSAQVAPNSPGMYTWCNLATPLCTAWLHSVRLTPYLYALPQASLGYRRSLKQLLTVLHVSICD